MFQSDGHSEGSLNPLSVYLLVSLFFVIATMVEFAVVLMLKRIVQFNDSQIEFEDNNVKGMQKYISNPTKLNDKRGTSDGDISKVDLEIDAKFSRHTCKFTVTDRIDFAALCIFLTSYASFNCIYMTYYCA